MPVPPPTTYRQASVSIDIHKLSIYPHSPPRPVLGLRWANKTHMTMGTQAAGRKTTTPYIVPRMPHPGPRCAHTEETGRSLVQRSYHLTTCRSEVSLSVCQRLSSSGSPPRVMPSSFTAAALLPCRLLSPLHTPAWRSLRTLSRTHTRRLHAQAAHRVPTARADRPPCRPDTGMRPSRTRSREQLLDSRTTTCS
jgi:hypothetical protein